MRVLFIGGTRRGHLTLDAMLRAGIDVAGVISLRQDEHEIDRFEQPMRDLAAAYRVPLWETKWLKDRDYVSLIRDEIRPDIAFVVGCRVLIPPAVYELPRLGTLAVHDSLLPLYRGFAPLNWAILNGEDHTGVTLFYLSEGMDDGDIVAQRRVPIGPHDTAPEVYAAVCDATVAVIIEMCPALADGTAPRMVQSREGASYTCSRTPNDGEIDWRQPTAVIYNQIRALTHPYPGAFTFYGRSKVTIWSARPVADAPPYAGRIPGRIVGRHSSRVHVLTGDGVLAIDQVQSEGQPPVSAAEMFRSVRGTLGLRTADLIDEIRLLKQAFAETGAPRAES